MSIKKMSGDVPNKSSNITLSFNPSIEQQVIDFALLNI